MLCDNCDRTYHINPAVCDPAAKGVRGAGANMDAVSTKSLTLVDSIKNHGIILIVECPYCGRMKSRMVNYQELLDLPNTEEMELMLISSGAPLGALPRPGAAFEPAVGN